jgi:hypothetical protein
MLLVKDIFGRVSILTTEIDYTGQEGYIHIEETDIPDTPSELWDIVDGKLIIKEPPKISLDELRANKKAEINALKEKEEYADIEYLNNTYQADADSQNKLTSAVLLCQVTGLNSYAWWTADNKQVTLTFQELAGLGAAIASRSSALVAKGRELKDAADYAQTAEEIKNIKWEIENE